MKPSYIREILAATSQSEVISFAGGLPSADSFPMALLKNAFEELYKEPRLFQYASSAGYQPLLNLLREKHQVSSDRELIVTNGSQQGLDLIARAFLNPSDQVLVESPSYPGALQVFQLAQAELKSIDLNEGVIDLVKLRNVFSQNQIKLFYLISDFQNPTGGRYSIEQRARIAALCKEFQVMIIEDVPYRELSFDGIEFPLVSSFYPEGSTVLYSYSKTVCPGLRLGVLEVPNQHFQGVLQVKQITDLHSNIPSQHVLLSLLQSEGYFLHLEAIRSLYQAKHRFLVEKLNEVLAGQVIFEPVQGGMFLWVELNSELNIDMMSFAKIAMKHGVTIVPGDVFMPNNEQSKNTFRVNFSYPSFTEIELGVKRLAITIESCI